MAVDEPQVCYRSIEREPPSVLATKDQEIVELHSAWTREWNG